MPAKMRGREERIPNPSDEGARRAHEEGQFQKLLVKFPQQLESARYSVHLVADEVLGRISLPRTRPKTQEEIRAEALQELAGAAGILLRFIDSVNPVVTNPRSQSHIAMAEKLELLLPEVREAAKSYETARKALEGKLPKDEVAEALSRAQEQTHKVIATAEMVRVGTLGRPTALAERVEPHDQAQLASPAART